MKRNKQLLPLIVLLAVVAPAQAASAEDDGRASIKLKNGSTWKLDCRVFWSNQTIAFNGIEPSTTSEDKRIPASPAERALVCKKNGAAPTPANVSAPIKFKAENIAKYTIHCAHKDTGTGLTCSVSP
jgi:hypothetical protein